MSILGRRSSHRDRYSKGRARLPTHFQTNSRPSSVVYIRRARNDELYLISHFEQHILKCTKCCRRDFESPWYRPLPRSLCSRGHMYAYDLNDYLYSCKGSVCSRIDKSNRDFEVDFRPSWVIARSLLVAVGPKFVPE